MNLPTMLTFLRHVAAVALPFTMLIFLTGLLANDFAAVLEHGFQRDDWLVFNLLSISGLGLVYTINTLMNASRPCKWTPFRSARGIHGLKDSFHKFLSLMLLICCSLQLFIAVSLFTLFFDADILAALTSTKLHRMTRSIPAYMLIFLLFSLPLAPMPLLAFDFHGL